MGKAIVSMLNGARVMCASPIFGRSSVVSVRRYLYRSTVRRRGEIEPIRINIIGIDAINHTSLVLVYSNRSNYSYTYGVLSELE